jgi:hypothetical protein
MIHYSCDRCKRRIDPAREVRYVVKIDVQLAFDPTEVDEPEDDRDHLAEIHELLESVDAEELELGADSGRQPQTFDLCPQCYRRFVHDPLGLEAGLRLGFSHN